MKPIGYIQSCYKDKFATPRQPLLVKKATSELKILKEFQPYSSLQGLEEFSHIWLIFVFHENTNKKFHAKIHPPRLNGESTGIFASRSPHRPNPIGLSLAKIEKLEGDTLYLQGADLIDGTPIIDIKPYLPSIEALPDAQESWVGEKNHTCLTPQVSEEAEIQLQSYEKKYPHLREIIYGTLSSDPRPLAYKTKTSSAKTHVFRLYELDVLFTVEKDLATVLAVKPYDNQNSP